jgi:hypothetical protein
MKNIHVLQTENYSPLVHSTNKYGGYFKSTHYSPMKEMGDSYQHIYITNNEEIKDVRPHKGKWQLEQGQILNKFPTYLTDLSECKLVIMTTDQNLINDGVQAIDDEFLGWFVKNPSCEEVEVNKQYSDFTVDPFVGYKILIPKEEPKQETLEEAAENWVRKPIIGTKRESFIEGAKWQQERIENKSEQLINELESLVKDNNLNESYRAGITASIWRIKEWCELKEWFKQFKKK